MSKICVDAVTFALEPLNEWELILVEKLCDEGHEYNFVIMLINEIRHKLTLAKIRRSIKTGVVVTDKEIEELIGQGKSNEEIIAEINEGNFSNVNNNTSSFDI